MNRKYRNIIAGCIWLLGFGQAQAHDFWLEADTFNPEESQDVAISLRFGVGFKGETLPYVNDLFTDFSLTNQSGRATIKSVQGNDPAATITAIKGAHLLGYQSAPQFVELDAEKFNKYVEEEGVDYIQEVRERRGESDSPAPENFVRCAKALIQTGPADQDVFRKKLGYTLELIPQSDPYLLEKGDVLEFELLYKNSPIEGLQLQAVPKANPEDVQKIRTGKKGRASIIIDRPGVWLIKAVLILPNTSNSQTVKGAPIALWHSYWASYVFELIES